MQFLFAPLLGSLSDRFGRRPVILFSLLGSGLDYFLLAYAQTLPLFVIARIISGITGGNISSATAYIADISPPEKKAANFGLIGAAFGLGFVIGPALGGWLGEINLRLPFIVAGAVTLLNWLYGCFVLPESLKPENRRPFRWLRANPVGALADLARYPMVLALAGVHFMATLAHQVLPHTWVLFTKHQFGWGPQDVGFSLGFVGIMAVVVQGGLARKLIPRLGEPRALIVGLTVSALAFLAYGSIPQGYGWVAYVVIFFGALGGLTNPSLNGIVSRTVGDDEQGSVQGAMTSLVAITGILGPIIAAWLFGYFINDARSVKIPGAAFYAGVLMIACAIAIAIVAFRTIKLRMK